MRRRGRRRRRALSAALIVAAAVAAGSWAWAQGLKGDVNGDGAVDLRDALQLFRIVDGAQTGTPEQRDAGDVFPNPGAEGRTVGDGEASRTDAQQLLRYVVGLMRLDVLRGRAVFSVTPDRANVAVGAEQQFTAFSPDGSGVTWSLEGASDADLGTVSAEGLYTAPAQLPEPPVVTVRARSLSAEHVTATASVALLAADEPAVTREQAVALVTTEILDKLDSKDDAVVYGLQQPLDAGDVVSPAEFLPAARSESRQVSAPSPCWFFMVDEAPWGLWVHPALYVLVDCRTGEIVSQTRHSWYPMLNGQSLWNHSFGPEGPPDAVFIGENAQNGWVNVVSRAENAGVPTRSIDPGDIPPIPHMFPPLKTACDCTGVPRRYAVVACLSPEVDELQESAFDMYDVLRQALFSVTLINQESLAADAVYKALADLRARVRPCDVLVVMLLGHGRGGSVGTSKPGNAVQPGLLREGLELIASPAKYLIVEACCDAGVLFDILHDTDKKGLTPQVTVLTATNKASDSSTGIRFTGVSPIKGNGFERSAFTTALIACFSHVETLPEVHECLTSAASIGLIALRLRLADPQFGRFGSADTDQDGVLDARERELATDPTNVDSDGDGVCDGIEFARLSPLGALGAFKPVISGLLPAAPSAGQLPPAQADVFYDYTFKLRNGAAYNRNAPSETNPFGYGPKNGWTVVDGTTLPPGLTLDRDTGYLWGSTTAVGFHSFTVQYLDAMGATARRSVALAVRGEGPLPGAFITVSTTADGNARDDDLTLREAVMLATGKLSVGALSIDRQPNDNIPAGELRWLYDGVSVDPNRPVFAGAAFADAIDGVHGGDPSLPPPVVVLSQGPLALDTDGDVIGIGNPLAAQTGPLFRLAGNGNTVSGSVWTLQATGPAVEITGDRNQVRSVDLTLPADGTGIRVTGNDNLVFEVSIRQGAQGVRIEGGAHGNSLASMKITGTSENAIALAGGAHDNTVMNCSLESNTGRGVLLSAGATLNQIQENRIFSNAGVGILLTDQQTADNVLTGNEVGIDSRDQRLGPNADGIVVAGGANNNSIAGYCGYNNGHGVLVTGADTDENTVNVKLTANANDDLRIEDGATRTTVVAEVHDSRADGVSIAGAETYGNHLGSPDAGCLIQGAAGAGVRVADGANGTILEALDISQCGQGLVIDGTQTTETVVQGGLFRDNLGPGIALSGGCHDNSVTGVFALKNQGSGLLIEGANTRGNTVRECSFGNSNSAFVTGANARYGTEIVNGAQENEVSDCQVSRQTLGGVHLGGADTRGNRISRNVLHGGFGGDDIPSSGPGLLLTEGAQNNLVEANEISLNGGDGVRIAGVATRGNVLVSNRIGAQWWQAVTNWGSGIVVDDAPDNVIGSQAGGGNVILSNHEQGIRITGPNATGNRLEGNFIGTNAVGSDVFGNGSHGVLVTGGAHHNTIGGARPVPPNETWLDQSSPPLPALGAGNLICANKGDGIHLAGVGVVGNRVLGNLIGLSGGNEDNGVTMREGAQATVVGAGIRPGEGNPAHGNVILRNQGSPVSVSGGATFGNTFLRNTLALPGALLFVVVDGGNAAVQPATVSDVDLAHGRVSGAAPGRGIVEVYSHASGNALQFDLAAFVEPGPFVIDQLAPGQSRNAVVFDSQHPLREADYYATFTDRDTGNTSRTTLLTAAP